MPPRDSLLARGLEPLVAILWTLFVLVSLAVGIVWVFRIGEGTLESIPNPGLREALAWILGHSDFAWITLGAANVYLSLAASVGLATARRWGLLILGAVLALAWTSAASGFPLGQIRYGSPLGVKFGPVPLGLLLLWFSIIIGAREGLLWRFPRLGQASLAGAVALLALLTDLNLEPLAAKIRGFWFWQAASPALPPNFDPPLLASIAWGALAGVITVFLRERDVASSGRKRPWHPAAAWLIFNAVFLAANAGRKWGG